MRADNGAFTLSMGYTNVMMSPHIVVTDDEDKAEYTDSQEDDSPRDNIDLVDKGTFTLNMGSTNAMMSSHIVVLDDEDETEDTYSGEHNYFWDDIDWDHEDTTMKLHDFRASSI